MTRRRRGLRVGPLLLLALIVGGLWFFRAPLLRLRAEWSAPRVRTAVAVRTRPTESLELTTASGFVVPRRQAALASRHSARLVELRVDVGDRVAEGALLARLEPDVWRHELARVTAVLDQARADVESRKVAIAVATSRVTSADRQLERTGADVVEVDAQLREAERVLGVEERLATRGAGTEDARDHAENELARLRAVRAVRVVGVRAAEADRALAVSERAQREAEALAAASVVTAAQASVDGAANDLADTEIRAPFAGVVIRKEADVGELVVPALAGGGSNRGSVVDLVDFSSLEMEVDVFERDIHLVAPGMPARVFLDAYPNEAFEARVRQIVPTADRAKATVQVKVSFEALDDRVFPDMGGRAIFLRERPSERAAARVMAPRDAVVMRGGAQGVFELEQGRVRFRPVEIGVEEGGRVEIKSGLRGGERLVVAPPGDIENGMAVKREDENG